MVQRSALEHILRLAYEDQMTTDLKFFMGLTPTDPTVKYLLANVRFSQNHGVRNLSVRTLIVFLQV
jgi:hypothetical protein